MRTLTITVIAVAALTLPACTPRPGMASDGHAKAIPAATPTGPAVSCVQLAQIRSSRVRDDWTIDFQVSGNKWYRNTLPYRCNGLGFERTFSYSTAIPQLCNVDIITVFATNAPVGPRGSCGLGQFQPVTLAK